MILILFLMMLLTSCLAEHKEAGPSPAPLQFHREEIKTPDSNPMPNNPTPGYTQNLQKLHNQLDWVDQRLPKR